MTFDFIYAGANLSTIIVMLFVLPKQIKEVKDDGELLSLKIFLMVFGISLILTASLSFLYYLDRIDGVQDIIPQTANMIANSINKVMMALMLLLIYKKRN